MSGVFKNAVEADDLEVDFLKTILLASLEMSCLLQLFPAMFASHHSS